LNGLAQQVVRHGVLLVAGNVFLEQLGLPIPAVPTLVVAGALARDGKVSGPLLALVALLAAVVADTVWFVIGRRFGGAALRVVCKLSLSPNSCVRQTESLFARLGPRALLVTKFVPGLSAVSTPLAGASGMPFHTFLLFDAAGSLLWSGSAILAGALFHRQIEQVIAALASMGGSAAALVLSALALYLFWRLWERRRFARVFAMTRIAPDELAARLAAEAPPSVWDVRSETARRRDGRAIPGARLLRLEALVEDFADLPVEREIILYCT
jgi:membrane protein DedA with SNARE-associated domain